MLTLEDIKQLNLPTTPGSYQYYGKGGKILYVGKAANLRSRVFSYWRESAGHTPAKVRLVLEIERVKWIETDTEIESLLLEANLIKKYQPPYNIMLRDDKRFTYIKISTDEDFPRVFATRQVDKAGRYFGPFTSTTAVKETLRVLRRIWPYRSCASQSARACLYNRIGKCLGPCEGDVTKEEYAKVIRQIILFLEGKKKEIIKNLELQIKKYEKELSRVGTGQCPVPDAARRASLRTGQCPVPTKREELERLIQGLKYRVNNINHVLESSRIVGVGEKYANDVIELAKVLGLPKIPERIEGYDISNLFGKEAVGSMVVFSGGEPDKGEYRKFKIKSPLSGTNSNPPNPLYQGGAIHTRPLGRILSPLIKGAGGIWSHGGDVGMLKEVLERRFKHSSDAQITDQKSQMWALPDLIIIDGGKAQLNVGLRVLKSFKLDIPVIAISKGEGLRSALAPDKLFFPGEKKPLELPLASPALHLIKRVRDEAHRFAIGYHKKLRGKRFLEK